MFLLVIFLINFIHPLQILILPANLFHDFFLLNYIFTTLVNPLRANPIKWSNTLKQFVGKLPTNYLSVFDHFVELALKELKSDDMQEYFRNIKEVILVLTHFQ